VDGQFERRDLLESCIIKCCTKGPAHLRDSLFRTEGTADFAGCLLTCNAKSNPLPSLGGLLLIQQNLVGI
jgi:hypothetical protein